MLCSELFLAPYQGVAGIAGLVPSKAKSTVALANGEPGAADCARARRKKIALWSTVSSGQQQLVGLCNPRCAARPRVFALGLPISEKARCR